MNLKKKRTLHLGITFAYIILIAFSVRAIANKIIQRPDENKEGCVRNLVDVEPDAKNSIKVALLLDTSGSMDGLLSQAKSQLWSIINKLSDASINSEKPRLQIALYEYGNDRLSSESGYIKRIVPFSSDLDLISEKLFAMSTNGGSEYCGHVIQKAVNELDWNGSDGDLRLIFIAGNERFDQGGVSYRMASKMARSKNIVINPIYCGDFQVGVNTLWRVAADITDGEYMSIEQDRKTVYISSPYDDDILHLNEKLNKTYIPYGTSGSKFQSRQQSQDKNASSYGMGNIVKRAISKSKKVYSNASWDLVDASKKKDFRISEVEEEALPVEIQSLSDKELIGYISEKQLERESIQEEINQLNAKRKKYVAEQEKTDGSISNLENALLLSIAKQASKKGYSF